MAEPTHGERIAGLEKRVGELEKFAARFEPVATLRLDSVGKQVDVVAEGHAETKKVIDELRREYEKELALLKRELEELKKSRDQTLQRIWMVVAPFLAGVLSAVLTYQLGLKK